MFQSSKSISARCRWWGAAAKITDADDVTVRFEQGSWPIERGNLRTEFDAHTRHGRIVQSG